MTVAKVVLMVVITFFVTATAMPFVLVTVPAAQDDKVGLAMVCGIALVVFAVLWLAFTKIGRRK
jgi:hypothetical protein